MHDTVIVVPCYNEARRLEPGTFQKYAQADPRIRFLFVDDGSTDGTDELLERLCSERPPGLEWLKLETNVGKGEAVRAGVTAAVSRDVRYFGYWDADLSTPLEMIDEFRNLLRQRSELRVVMGSRVRLLGYVIERRAVRHYLGRVFATATSLILGAGVYDTQCGAKLFRADRRTLDLFREPFVSTWLFDVEILARLDHTTDGGLDRAVLEVPLREWRDVAGSKVDWRGGIRALIDLWRIRRRYR